ncbi:MAG: guanylate kinase [Tenericutes bacterium]|nr:guanylate kinase [Mycoplasmatota bacterium]
MLVLLGPSASGKTESAKIMINRYPISRVVTCTTREKRINEIDGFDYHFFSVEEFKKLAAQDYFVETAEYNNYLYGTPRNELADNKFIILEPQGLKSFLKLKPCTIVAIFLRTEEDIRILRMKERKDKQKDIQKRIESDRNDFDLNKINGLDLIIDTSNKSLSDVADLIFSNYQKILEQKQGI